MNKFVIEYTQKICLIKEQALNQNAIPRIIFVEVGKAINKNNLSSYQSFAKYLTFYI